MIEIYLAPILGNMACGTVLRELTGMGVVLGMARLASLWCALVEAVYVAVNTCYGDMCAGERKSSQRVIESSIFPTLDGMAGSTVLAKLSIVGVILGMAIDAYCGSFCQGRGLVAVLAGNSSVLSQ
ncbi:MAG TPA: hypothetical protein VLA49_04015 [Anaerolineales bacterium]|nr:hypothetical protein [Anaerolineales bacterium]